MKENSAIEKKSLKIVQGDNTNWRKLAKEAVCFANAYGGKLLIGIEDDSDLPPDGQLIEENLPYKIVSKIEQNTINVGLQPGQSGYNLSSFSKKFIDHPAFLRFTL